MQNDVGVAVFREMAALFLNESTKLFAEIRGAMTRGDAMALRRAAHTLKGSAAVFAAEPATAASLRLETIAKEDKLNEAEAACSGSRTRDPAAPSGSSRAVGDRSH